MVFIGHKKHNSVLHKGSVHNTHRELAESLCGSLGEAGPDHMKSWLIWNMGSMIESMANPMSTPMITMITGSASEVRV